MFSKLPVQAGWLKVKNNSAAASSFSLYVFNPF